ncbi:hypothetical protein ZIOFF_001548 [Zingiber officinale]|uniref:Two-component response regulator n=1 Tax=Zingiber officinale TaxID=94328 RepID=A0A8J5M7Q7_ZINOF|nr:hypothetical protein ZIOFF_001548 [Zingiber officinale]
MIAEETKGIRDQFPVGMRVLAVDDDPICLKLLEVLLVRCQYKVTTTDKAIMALNMLRENRNTFDLVISDVHMPDMDGFKLLEHVGLEMDLPVIMLSANGETQTVMKGISHGACDYLLKPVRIEELRNIWQHVIRRRKFEKRYSNDPENGDDDLRTLGNSEDGHGADDLNGKITKKRKDQSETDENDSEDNTENDDPSNQKKPRVVWTIELHRKFVAAVNQLGIDKAVPKKILDLMNVEKLTRENVASHLQACFSTLHIMKYRLYLKRLSAVAGQQACMVAAVGSRSSSYLNMASLNGFRNYYAIGGSSQLPTIGSLQPTGVLGRMNSSSTLGMQGLLPSRTVQLGGMHKSTNNSCSTELGNIQGITSPGNHQLSLLHGVPMSLEVEQFPQLKLEQERRNQLPTGFSGVGLLVGPKSNSFPSSTSNSLLVQANKQHNQSGGIHNYPLARMPSSSSEIFDFDLQDVSLFTSNSRSRDGSWQGAAASIDQPINALPILAPFRNNVFSSGSIGANVSSIASHPVTKTFDECSNTMAALHNAITNNNINNHVPSLNESTIAMPPVHNDSRLSNFSLDNSTPRWDYCFNPNAISSTYSSSLYPKHQNNNETAQFHTSDIAIDDKKLAVNAEGQVNFGASLIRQDCMIDRSTVNSQLNFKREHELETSSLPGGLNSNGSCLADVVNSMIKSDDDTFGDIDMGCDLYIIGACM